MKIGVPTLTFQFLTSLSIALSNRAANGYGDAVIAGMGAVTRVTSMGTLVVFGFLKGFQPIAGYSYGAKKYDRLREAIKTSIFVVNPVLCGRKDCVWPCFPGRFWLSLPVETPG